VHMLSNTVQIFFIISGMVIPISMIIGNYQYKHFFTFLWKRTLRIEPPYIVSMVVGMLYLWVRNFVPGSAPVNLFPTWQEILLHLGYLIPFFENMRWINPGYWTLAIEFQYYLVLALIFPLVMSDKRMLRVVFYLILLGMPFLYTNNDCFTGWGAYFLLGLIYILHYFKRVPLAEYILVSIAASAVTLVHYDWPILAIAWGTIILVYFFQDWENKFTHFFGNISYSFYLLHSLVGASIINFLSHRFTIWWEKPLVIAIGFLASTIAAHYYFQWIEKPSMGWSKKIKYNR
jgi:peptidoglycan/LPS O-acetylase OafA/YrhL